MPEVQVPGGTPPPVNPHKVRIIVLASVAVVLIAAIGIVAYVHHRANAPMANGKPAPKAITVDHVPAGYKTTPVASGDYPSGFPKGVALDGDSPTRAEDTILASGQEDKVIEYNAAPTPEVLYTMYQQQLPIVQPGWTLDSKQNDSSGMVLVFKDKTADKLQISFLPDTTNGSSGSHVRFDYMPVMAPSK